VISNKPPKDFYQNIAARAVRLQEKIDEPHKFDFIPAPDRETEERLAEWRRCVGPGDEEMFLNRLKNDGLNPDEPRKLLGTVTFKNQDDLPSWITPFGQLIGFLGSCETDHLPAEMARLFGTGEEKRTPFLHLLTPLVACALENLDKATAGGRAHLLTEEACLMMNLQLARLLGSYTSQTFHLEFKVFAATRQSPVSRLFEMMHPDLEHSDELYQQFTEKMHGHGWQDFFSEYSVLARIITILLENWTSNTADFLNRLGHDMDDLTGRFSGGVPPGRVTEYRGGMSDPHDHGKSVISLKFGSGLKLVYKPKNMELELAWSDLLKWFNEQGLDPCLKSPEVLQRGDYGWAGFIEAAECSSLQEVAEYYRRIGSLIGMIYMLSGNDCHSENLIASGPYPVLVDLETVMHHEGRDFTGEQAESAMSLAIKQFGASVFRTGLLPAWIQGKGGLVFDVSGMGGYDLPASPYNQVKWEHINTDRMDLLFILSTFGNQNNLPVLKGQAQLPAEFTGEIVAGFTAFYQLLIRFRSELPIHLFAGKELRFIFRSTRIYGMIMKPMMNPKYMRYGLDRSIQAELLCRAFLHQQAPHPDWVICKSERSQMEETDIPIFRADSDKTDLKDPAGNICRDYIPGAVYEKVKSHLQEMDEKDLGKQVKFIRAALFFRNISHDSAKGNVEMQIDAEAENKPLKKEMLIGKALKIARMLDAEAVFSKDGGCSWMSVGIIPGTERFRMEPMLVNLYDGLSGVALFLSALSSFSEDPLPKKLFDATVISLRQGIRNIQQNAGLARIGPVGIASGLPSVIYALLKIADFTGDGSFTEDAVSICSLVTPVMIKNDNSLDIVSGSAGCILAMLSLYDRTNHGQALEKAILCGDHLLSNLFESADGLSGWKTMQGKMLTGFSHGQAGIAHSLLKLYEATGSAGYFEAARKAIQYENSLFSAENLNWPDLRDYQGKPAAGSVFTSAWCHGAPGILLGRLASRHIFTSQEIEKNIRDAATTCLLSPVSGSDHLCCGSLGLADILLYAGIRTGNEELRTEAGLKVQKVIRRAEQRGWYTMFAGLDDEVINPGLFQGLSGIGYEMLRFACPEKMPSILVFD
jgi:type 2 lantibiotic biosynthesis protein LanM